MKSPLVSKRLQSALLFAAVLVITLGFGLKPKGFRIVNKVDLELHGLAFNGGGVAVGQSAVPLLDSGKAPIWISLDIIGGARPPDYIAPIISLCDREGNPILFIGQWRTHLVVRLYPQPFRRRLFRDVSLPNAFDRGAARTISLFMDSQATAIRVSGQQDIDKRNASVWPALSERACMLVVGCGSNGKNCWNGILRSAAIGRMRAGITMARFINSADTTTRRADTLHWYRFSEASDGIIKDAKKTGPDILVPRLFWFPKKEVLVSPLNDFRNEAFYWIDVIINLVGFLPMGIAGFLFFRLGLGISPRSSLLAAITTALLVSVGIELTQVYIPTRTSQFSDVALNVLGGLWGGFAMMQRLQRQSR
jgi:VanZ family protein